MASQQGQEVTSGPPYLPHTASIGGVPNTSTDVPVSAVFLAIFVCLGAVHMTIFQINRIRGHFFVFSAATFGFCMARAITYIMRIVWAEYPTNVRVAIAAQIFLAAGVIALYVINLNYAQRIMRAYHPKFGHSKPVFWAFLAYYLTIIATLIMVITATVLLFYTLNKNTLKICQDIQHFALIYFTVSCFLPFPIVLISRWTSRRENKVRFGKLGTLTHKVIIVLVAATLLLIEALFRAVATLLPAHPITNPPWYDKRAAYYCFLPTIEVLVAVLYAVTRVDQRFFIDGEEKEAQKESQNVQDHYNEY